MRRGFRVCIVLRANTHETSHSAPTVPFCSLSYNGCSFSYSCHAILNNCGAFRERLTRLIERTDPECAFVGDHDILLAKHVMLLTEWIGDKDYTMKEFLMQLVTPTLDLNVHPAGVEHLSQTTFRHCNLDTPLQEALLLRYDEGVWFDPNSHQVYPQHKLLPEARAFPGLSCSITAHPSIFPVLQQYTKAEFSRAADQWTKEACGTNVQFFTAYMLQTAAQVAHDTWTVDLDGAQHAEHVTVSVNDPAGLPAEIVDPSHSVVHHSVHHSQRHRVHHSSSNNIRIPVLEMLPWSCTDQVLVVRAEVDWPIQHLPVVSDNDTSHSTDTTWSHLVTVLNDILYRGDVCLFMRAMHLHALMQSLTTADTPTQEHSCTQVMQVLKLVQQMLLFFQRSAEFVHSEVQDSMQPALESLASHFGTVA